MSSNIPTMIIEKLHKIYEMNDNSEDKCVLYYHNTHKVMKYLITKLMITKSELVRIYIYMCRLEQLGCVANEIYFISDPRFLFVLLIISRKLYEDKFYANSYYGKLMRVDYNIITLSELSLLSKINFYVSNEQYDACLDELYESMECQSKKYNIQRCKSH